MLLKIIAIAVCISALGGCASYSMQTASAPISANRAKLIVDGTSTRIDVVSLFGNPNGFNPTAGSGGGGAMMMAQRFSQNAPKTDKMLHYKDCVATSAGKAGILSGDFIIPRSSMVEVCKVFTALLDDNDTVVAHAYLDNNFVTKDRLKHIKEGVSNKQVIRTLGGPSSITASGGSQIYIYKTCVTKSSVRAWNPYNTSVTNRQSCQQTTILLNKNGIAERVTFIPWDDSPI